MNLPFNHENIAELETSPETFGVGREVRQLPIQNDRPQQLLNEPEGVSIETAEILEFSRNLASTGVEINDLVIQRAYKANGADEYEVAV